MKKMKNKKIAALALLAICFSFSAKETLAQRRTGRERQTATQRRTSGITVQTEPNATVWLDDIRRGTTDAQGRLEIRPVAAGRHTLRVRARGFTERVLPVLPAQRGRIAVRLTRTTDEAELAFQEAEERRDRATNAEERRAVAELYRRALQLRPRFPAAHVGLARTLLALSETQAAFEQVDEARADRPNFAEASVVEGRIHRADANTDAAIESYRRAIREARGRQPEAYTGLGIIYEERGQHEEAADSFRRAIAQLADTEPILYQLLGSVYERQDKYREAVEAYENYLRLAPEGNLAPAIRSVIDQLRRQAAGEGMIQPF
jgi:tetratricopeptide (TPR) repeat protein